MSNTFLKIGDKELSQEELAMLSIAVAMDKKAVRPVMMDLKNLGAFTELFAIVSASNQRQVYAIAEHIRQTFKQCLGLSPISVDGLESSSWVLIDYGFLFVHIFQEPTRDLYQLEQLWSKARFIDIDEEKCQLLLNEVNKISNDLNAREIDCSEDIRI
ncbi:ribosome silencing factor [Spirobacillus cienkowskii]|uniref:Ribosomal silencing factor RsfS n=1 Tax=Spirobacillus cienkowskii TaxID=495820 RepID=A0A369KRD7_9BACT|nr:MAG: ribosome silencing factor [Spirobacillus cienkowskii]